MSNPYPWGQCTYYVASVYPQIPWDMGNGGDWLRSAQRHGYPVSNVPHKGWVVVYEAYGSPGSVTSFGHVAVVEDVSPNFTADHTFWVGEMNYRGLGIYDRRQTTLTSHMLGFFQPPGAPNYDLVPAGLDVKGTVRDASVSAPSSVSNSGVAGAIVNASTVIGGFAVVLFGGVLGIWGTGSFHRGVDAVTKRQGVAVKRETAKATQQRREGRRKLSQDRKPVSVGNIHKTRKERIAAAVPTAAHERATGGQIPAARAQEDAEARAARERELAEVPF